MKGYIIKIWIKGTPHPFIMNVGGIPILNLEKIEVEVVEVKK